MDLEALAEEVERSTAGQVREKQALTLENLKTIWQHYIDQIEPNRNSIKNILEKIELAIDGQHIRVLVSSKLSENAIRQERPLMDFLRRKFGDDAITLSVELDKSKAPKAPRRKEVLTPKQIYQKKGETNPLLHELRKRFDLRPDQD